MPTRIGSMLLAVILTSAVASATPRESATFTTVDSVGVFGNASNQTRTAAFAGSVGGVSYTPRFISVSGTLTDTFGTGSWAREAMIQITPPGGQSFVCAPFSDTTYLSTIDVPIGRYALPIGPFSTAGVWTFRFFESYDDDPNGTDQTWDTITFTLDDGPLPVIATPGGGLSSTFTDVPSDLGVGAGAVRTATFSETGLVNRIQLVGRLTLKTPVTADNLYNVASEARVRVTPPTASGLGPFDMSPAAGMSTGAGNVTVELPGAPPGGVPAAGVWSFEFYETVDEPTGADAVWQTVSLVLQSTNPPPNSVNIRTLADGGTTVEESDFATATVPVVPGQVSWVRFDIPRDAGLASYSALDIDLVGSTGVPSNDFSMALYSPAGVLVARAYDNGPGLLPQISIGPGTRTRNGDGLPYDGSDQTRSPQGQVGPNLWPDVPVGTCYVAVCSGNDAQFGTALWSVTPSQQANAGTATVRVRNYRTIPAVAPVGAQDLGLLQGVNNGVLNFPADPSLRSKWFRFLIFTGASDASGKYIDIDTANTTGGTADTNIALYNSSGVLVASNNDILPGYGAGNPTGGNSALSFGATAPVRSYSALNPNMPPGNGRNGPLTAGVYYLQVSECCAGFGADRFWVINDYVSHLDPGSVNWAVRTNYAPPCGFSDVGNAGGVPGADNRLDNNDFIVFVSLYFQQAQAADLGTQGGFAGRDGVWDNNDFVVFVDGFFAAPATCR